MGTVGDGLEATLEWQRAGANVCRGGRQGHMCEKLFGDFWADHLLA